MGAFGFWPVAIQPLGPVACGTTLWRRAGRLHVTIVVKATLRLEPDREMGLLAPEPVRQADGDLDPYLARADVLLTHAYAYANGPTPTPTVAVRLALIRGTPLIDKRLLVYGPPPRPQEHASLFTRAALVVGDPAVELGRVLDPRVPGSRAGLGPLARAKGSADRSAPALEPRLVREVLEIPEALPFDHYQQAPADQQTSYLEGDEWIVLDGMQPDRPRLSSRLPGARATARVYAPSGSVAGGPTFEVAMRADRLSIDAEARQCWLSWRGSFPVADEMSARSITLVGALLMPGQSVWSEPGRAISAPLALEPRPRLSGAPPPPSEQRPDGDGPRGTPEPKRHAEYEPPPWEVDACDTTQRLRRRPRPAAGQAPVSPSIERSDAEPVVEEGAAPGLMVEESTDGVPETVRYDRATELGVSGSAGPERLGEEADTRRLRLGDSSPPSSPADADPLDGRKTAVRPEGLRSLMRPEDLPLASVEELEQTLSGAGKLSARDVALLDQLGNEEPDGSEKPGAR
jgi:hypothetical protein